MKRSLCLKFFIVVISVYILLLMNEILVYSKEMDKTSNTLPNVEHNKEYKNSIKNLMKEDLPDIEKLEKELMKSFDEFERPEIQKPKEKDKLTSRLGEIEDMEEINEELQKYLEVKFIPISLEECLKIAMVNNYDIKIITQEKERSRWLYYKNITKFLPNLSHEFFIAKYSGEFLAANIIPYSTNETGIRSAYLLDWDILDGLEKFFNTQAAKRRYDANKENLEFEKEKTLIDVTLLYYTLLEQKLTTQIFTQNLKQRNAQLEITKQGQEAGIGTKFDVLRAQASVAAAKQQLLNSYNNLRLTQASLANALGIDVFTPLYPTEKEVKQISLMDENLSIKELSDLAINSRADLAAFRLAVKAAQSDKRAAYSTYIPSVNVAGLIQNAGTRTVSFREGFSLGLYTNWKPLQGLGVYGKTNIKEKDAIYKKEQLKMMNLQRKIQENIIDSYYDSRVAQENIIAAKQEVESADQSLKLAFLRLEAGIGIFVDVLQAQAAAVLAKINLINIIIDYNTAQAQLLFDTGVISVNNLIDGYNTECQKEESDESSTKEEVEPQKKPEKDQAKKDDPWEKYLPPKINQKEK